MTDRNARQTMSADTTTLAAPVTTRTGLFIDGAFRGALGEQTFETRAPSNGRLLAAVADADEVDVDVAVVSARAAFDRGEWSRATPRHRRKVLVRLAQLVEDHAGELALLDSMDAGKPITDCETEDIPEVARLFRWYGEAIDKVFGRIAPTSGDELGLITREPVGVVGVVVPWNYPAVMFAYKVAPALAAGNSVVVKPAELAPLSALLLAELASRAGVPDGVLNVVPGAGAIAGRAVGLHSLVDAVSFTGSTATGRAFLRYAADSNLKNVVLELGGKSPQIVLADMRDELDTVAEDLVSAAFANAGQNCTAGSRILVAAELREELTELLSEAASAWVVGDPLDRATQMGPLVSASAQERVKGYVDEAVASGAHVRHGGGPVFTGTGGSYFAPTILDRVDPKSRIARDEIFGPVTCVMGFDAEDEAIALANDTEYGLAATVWTRDLSAAVRVSRALRAGTVAVNGYSEGDVTTPFGGHRLSGFGGRDGGIEGLEQYTELKTTWITL
jgi:gamma-glutamyl-gamma-aminobutyraldehyde dehydrogenase